MELGRKLYFNIIIHSTSYLAILASYFISLYELWEWGEKKEEKDKTNSNTKTTIILLIPHIIALLEINQINILSFLLTQKQKILIQREKLILNLNDILYILNKSSQDRNNCGEISKVITLLAEAINEYMNIAKKNEIIVENNTKKKKFNRNRKTYIKKKHK